MSLLQTLTVFELIDNAHVSGQDVVDLFTDYPAVSASTHRVTGAKGATDFVRITIPGSAGKSQGGTAPTLGIIGRLGGIGARPTRIGVVSDADGAIAAISSALKLAEMQRKGQACRIAKHSELMDDEAYQQGLQAFLSHCPVAPSAT